MIEVINIDKIGDLIDFGFSLANIGSNKRRVNYTYRGQSNVEYKLKTSLRRNSENNIKYAEKRLLNNFRKYGQIIEPKICDSVWSNMIIAQHHGVPTRLLDFSLSPLIALHFALDNIKKDNVPKEDAAVWAINHKKIHSLLPEKYKKKLLVYNANSYTIEMLAELDLSIDKFNKDMDSACFLFLEPPSIDDRIVNQYSHLALLPDTLDPLDDFLNRLPDKNIAYKFVVPSNKILLFREQLDSMNINERVLFPGLDGLSHYLKRRYFFG